MIPLLIAVCISISGSALVIAMIAYMDSKTTQEDPMTDRSRPMESNRRGCAE